MRKVGSEFVAFDSTTIYRVVGYRDPWDFNAPLTHELVEAVGVFCGGEKRYYDGRVEYVPDWQI